MIPIHCKEALMKFSILVAALIASVALAVPAEAASKKRKKVSHRAAMSALQAGYVAPGVYFHEGDIGRKGHCNNGWIVFKDYAFQRYCKP